MSSQRPGPGHGLTKENFLTALPVALREDASIAALAETAAEFLARPIEEIERLKLYPAIDGLDEKLLDILAVDFKLDWWDADFSVEEKRRLLKGCWRVHKLQGTKAGLETAVSAIYPDSVVREWFEYEGGEPHHFRIRLGEATHSINEDGMKKFQRAMGIMKRLSSHLDEVQADCTATMTAYHSLHNGQLMEISGSDIIHAGVGHYAALPGGVLMELYGGDTLPGTMEWHSILAGAEQVELEGNDIIPSAMARVSALPGGTMLEFHPGEGGAEGGAEL